ncbi:MAG: hypothetical protein P4M14_12430 [Gammaproteobacteria bacterium]|nr:hypothetical protein [Gammaproteobacteria bacterium]
MKHIIKKLFLILPILNIASLYAITPQYNIRSQGVNAARDLAGLTHIINLDRDNLYGTLYGTFEYSHSWKSNSITRSLFGNDLIHSRCTGNPSIVISGSQTLNRASTDWLADYFGLPVDFKSVVSFKPIIQNFIFDLGFYIGLDCWAKGLYFKVNAPITNTRWDLGMQEIVSTPGSLGYPAGYVSPIAEPLSALLSNFTEYASGEFVPTFSATNTIFGFDNLSNAQMSPDALVSNGLAEVRAVIGWNYEQPDYHAGVLARFAAPSGSRPTGRYLFEPIVGNNHHWEFGGGITSHYTFWRGCDEQDSLGLYVDANLTHLFKARQHRTFDLLNKPNSRYMLAQKINATRTSPQLSTVFPNVQYQNELSPVENLTTMDVDVAIAVQGDVVALFNYTHKTFTWDIGYNFWAISCERIHPAGCPTPLDQESNTWALKGDASVIGFENNTLAPVYLAATESQATIHEGTNFPASGTNNTITIQADRANPNIDAPALAVTTTPNIVLVDPAPFDAITNQQTRSSLSPIFLSNDDVDFAGTSGLSNKIFTHVSYVWPDRPSWAPFLGAGAELEFGSNDNDCSSNCTSCISTCFDCQRCSVSQWGVWLKGGVTY